MKTQSTRTYEIQQKQLRGKFIVIKLSHL
jgi:hypothetical protein